MEPGARRVGIKVGSTVVTGVPAVVILIVLLGLIAGLLIWIRPTVRMWSTGALWVAFLVYWSIAARSAAPAVSTESPASRAIHTRLLYLALLLLFLPVPGLRSRFVPLVPAVTVAGLTIQALGILLAIWSRRHLGRNWSGAISIAAEHQLVRTGPYRSIRHPIYSAMFLMYLGTATVSGELHALVALAVLTAAYWRKIRLEEKALSQAFGAEFETYRQGTRLLIPYLL
jgi:protein-S-isoprenylcysteine O-methyltransferase Ste14